MKMLLVAAALVMASGAAFAQVEEASSGATPVACPPVNPPTQGASIEGFAQDAKSATPPTCPPTVTKAPTKKGTKGN